MALVHQETWVRFGTNGIGISDHQNRYSNGVRVANWVENDFGTNLNVSAAPLTRVCEKLQQVIVHRTCLSSEGDPPRGGGVRAACCRGSRARQLSVVVCASLTAFLHIELLLLPSLSVLKTGNSFRPRCFHRAVYSAGGLRPARPRPRRQQGHGAWQRLQRPDGVTPSFVSCLPACLLPASALFPGLWSKRKNAH